MAALQDEPGVAPDRQAAEKGEAAAQYAMGLRYTNGLGVPQHYGMALGWFLDAAEQGHAGSQYMLGVSYAVGRGVDKDPEEAVHWFPKPPKAATSGRSTNWATPTPTGAG